MGEAYFRHPAIMAAAVKSHFESGGGGGFKGLAKNTAQVITLFALSNLWMARKRLMAMTGSLRPQFGN